MRGLGDAARPADGAGLRQIPARILEHRALLVLPDGTPFSEVVETYTGEVFAFPEPGMRWRSRS